MSSWAGRSLRSSQLCSALRGLRPLGLPPLAALLWQLSLRRLRRLQNRKNGIRRCAPHA